MVSPMQPAYSNFPQPATQHFQPQSPVYASQVLHPTMMVQDPMVRIDYNRIHKAYEISVIVLCWFLIGNSINILHMSLLSNCSCASNNSSSSQQQTLYHHSLSVMSTHPRCIPANRLCPKHRLLLVSPVLVL